MKSIPKAFNSIPLDGSNHLMGNDDTTGGKVSASPKTGMTRIVYDVDINAPKTTTWKVLENFGDLHWTDGVTGVRYLNKKRTGVDMARRCDLKDGGYLDERITHWNEGNGFTYAIDNASDPIADSSYVTWSVSGDEHSSRVRFEVHYKLKYWILGKLMNALMAKKKFSKQIAKFMTELKVYAERQH